MCISNSHMHENNVTSFTVEIICSFHIHTAKLRAAIEVDVGFAYWAKMKIGQTTTTVTEQHEKKSIIILFVHLYKCALRVLCGLKVLH